MNKKKVTITLTEEAVEILEKKSKELNISKSDYVNRILTSKNNTGRKEKLSTSEKEHILNKYTLGVSISKLAKQFNCSRNTIYKIIKQDSEKNKSK